MLTVTAVIYVSCGSVAICSPFIFFYVLDHIFHNISFWRGNLLKKLMKDCMATGTFQEM